MNKADVASDAAGVAAPGAVPTAAREAKIAAAVREILVAIGEDPERDGLRETPARIARAMSEVFAGIGHDPDAVLDAQFDVGFHEMVIVRDIGFCLNWPVWSKDTPPVRRYKNASPPKLPKR